MKIDTEFENGCSIMKEYEFRHNLSPFRKKKHLK